ncbi:MAG: PEP-CTERM sorting domain-containing protein, partial [Verrucomicrobia bacterium]|nr:PEP-CTERM sorting domain-containing protein [Verrucomicrobiota bacterium]
GSYDLQWTGSANPSGFGGPASSLPANANAHSVYSFSDGKRTMSTVGTTIPVGVTGWTEMTYSVDFQMGGTGGVDNNEISILVNRSGNNGYNAAIYTGGDGNIAFYGDYGVAWTGVNAAANTWYKFKTTVTKSGANISMQSQILNSSNNVLATSATKTFTNAAYTDPNGFKIDLGNYGGYWNHATQIDNFVVTAVPEPSTVALLGGLGALSLIRRRRTR